MHHDWTFLVALHAITASYAMVFGAVNLLRAKKGDKPHKVLGYIWLACMYFVIISSFWIKDVNPGQYSWIHGLSIFTFFTISFGLFAAIKGKIKAHKFYMTGSYFGLLGAFTGVVAVPKRLIPQMAVHDLARLLAFAICVLVSATLFVYGTLYFFKDSKQGKRTKKA